MPGPFDRNRPDAAQSRRVKALCAARFDLPETTMLTRAYLRCHEPGCPPIEMVITVRPVDGAVCGRRIPKPVPNLSLTSSRWPKLPESRPACSRKANWGCRKNSLPRSPRSF